MNSEILQNIFFKSIIALIVSVILTYAVRAYARKRGFVAKPKADRWHKKPTAMLGGVSIFLTTVILSLLFVQQNPASLVILASSTFLFLVGLIDDLLNIKPYQKLLGQIFGVAIVVSGGIALSSGNPDSADNVLIPFWTNFQIINIFIATFWLVGITNAINLLDNMDGLSAGISIIAAISLAVGFAASGQYTEVTLIAIFIGAMLGFLVFNFNPASIFMGDCGSMFVGFFLASSVLLTQSGGRSRGLIFVLSVPVLILFVPIFDTTFVTLLRKIWGRKASQGGRDHTSHRLVALGLSERSAVLMLYAFAILAGGISILIRELEFTKSTAIIAFFVLLLTFIGVYLAKVKVYEEQDEELALQNNVAFGFIYDFSYKRRIFEIFLDIFLVILAYYTSYSLLFKSFENSDNWNIFLKSVPILVVCNLFSFLLVGVYRGLWRYTGLQDFFTFSKGVILGTISSVLVILVVYRFSGFSRSIFVLNAMLLFFCITGSRLAFRLFRQILPAHINTEGIRVLIYGAGDGGEMVLRELNNNPNWNYHPIGFIDDDTMKERMVIHGLPVFSANGDLLATCKNQDIQEILVSTRKISAEKIKELKQVCGDLDISLKRASLKIEAIDFDL